MKTRVARVPAVNEPFENVDVELAEPGEGEVRVAVAACGVCHSDVITVTNAFGGVKYPRAPGHEVAGRIDAMGPGVKGWQTGDRVGVGWFGGNCGYCDRCRRGDFITCRRMKIAGLAYDGGYARHINVPASALAKIPDALTDDEAAPLLCAGITTFNALRHSGAVAGDLVAIHGIGGLGHLGVQFAAKMGFHTVAIARGADKGPLATSLGAHQYIDSEAGDAAAELKRLGGARVVLATVTNAKAMAAMLPGLGVDGALLVVGAPHDPITFSPAMMIGPRQSIRAWPSGTAADSEDTLRFAALTGVRPMIERYPFEKAQEAYDRMMSGAARFRVVLSG